MPQMSPMNWMVISLMTIILYKIMKTNTNMMFKSKKHNKKPILMEKSESKW